MCRTDDYPPHDPEPRTQEDDDRPYYPGPMHDYGYPCPCYDCAGPHADADRYAEALAGARAMRAAAVTWSDGGPGADDYERRHGIPDRGYFGLSAYDRSARP
jgi:hypothetical protein